MAFALGLDDSDYGYDGEEESSRSQNPIVDGMIDAAAGKIDAITNSNDDYYRGGGFDGNHASWDNQVYWRAKDMQAQKEAAAKLKNGEKNASNKGTDSNNALGGLNNAKNAEQNSENGFSANVVGKVGEKAVTSKVPGGKKVAANLKKMGPFGSILLVLIGFAALLSGAQSLSPFGLISNGLDQFNGLRTAMNKRSTYFSRFMLDNTRNKPITRATIFGNEKFKISPIMERRLAKHNISYLDDVVGVDGKKVRMLVYTDPDTGETMGIATKQSDIDNMPGRVTTPDGVEVDLNKKIKLDDAIVDSKSFSDALDRGTRTLKGHVAGWFDDTANTFLKKLTSRHRFSGDDADDGKKSDDEIVEEAKKNTRSEDLDDVDGSGNISREDGTDESGKPTSTEIDESNGSSSGSVPKNKNVTKAEVAANLNARAKAAAASAGTMANGLCTILRVYGVINATVAAMQVANIINYVTGFLEAVQKAQSGDGGAELHYYMNKLSEKGNSYGFDANSDTEGEELVRENTSSLESPAWNQFFSNGNVTISSNDKMAQKYNREFAMANGLSSKTRGTFLQNSVLGSDLLMALSSGSKAIEAFSTCNAIQAAAATVDVVTDIIAIAVTFWSGGTVGTVIKKAISELGKALKSGVLQVLVSIVASLLMQKIVPLVASLLVRDLITNMAGEDAAYAINSGFNIYSGKIFQPTAIAGTKSQVVAQYRDTQEIIAHEAEYDRRNRSPFDITSRHTFLGSIVNNLTPLANTLSTPLSTVSKTVSLVGSAIGSLSPTASAAGEVKFRGSLNESCPALGNLGLIGDAYCNPYFVSGYTIGNTAVADSDYYSGYIASNYSEDPADIFESVEYGSDGGENFDFDADTVNPPIKEGSELAKWVIAGAARESQPGTIDANIQAAISYMGANTGNFAVDAVADTAVGMIPVVGGIEQLVEAGSAEANKDWITYKAVMEHPEYARYSLDQRVLESAGLIEKSQVAVFLDNYYEKHPVDNSTEGIIASYSGLSKEDVNFALGFAEYQEYLANYNPEGKGPFTVEEPSDWQYESNEVIAIDYYAKDDYNVVYFDLRTRTTIS